LALFIWAVKNPVVATSNDSSFVDFQQIIHTAVMGKQIAKRQKSDS